MDKRYRIAIIGSGPAGISAAVRAAAKDRESNIDSPSHILLESFDSHAKTVQMYQKGKAVMAEPGYLTLRSDCSFQEATREQVLETWLRNLEDSGVNIRYKSEVTAVSGVHGNFKLSLSNGDNIVAENVVVAIGVQGNPRKVGVPGSEHPLVQYQLDDPDEYSDEDILVVGAGDAAIENAIALSKQNRVVILNRKSEFGRAKEGNLNAILAAINDDRVSLDCIYSTTIKEMNADSLPSDLIEVVLNTPEGEDTRSFNRVVARLGAIPQRKFVESMGIEFPNENLDAMPELDSRYQSNIAGIYVVGALAGYPLIKQAMNQGYDVIEFIDGNDIDPADQPLLEQRLVGLPFNMDLNDMVDRLKILIPMFSQLNVLQFRELLIESNVTVSYTNSDGYNNARNLLGEYVKDKGIRLTDSRITALAREGDLIYDVGEYSTSFYIVIDGQVNVEQVIDDGEVIHSKLGRGDFFGESSLLSGQPTRERAVVGPNAIFIEIPRRTMLKLIGSSRIIAEGISWIFTAREIQHHFVPKATFNELREIAATVETLQLKSGEVLYTEGDTDACLFLIKSGGITLSKIDHDKSIFVSQVRAGNMIGQLALMGQQARSETAIATIASEVIRIDKKTFQSLLIRPDARVDYVRSYTMAQISSNTRMEVRPEAGGGINFLLDNGLGEATNTLIIDESLCIGCDNCEKACAETHGGISQLNRRLGPTFGKIHIPTACRHCEQPHCMKDCPPNAIRRAMSGEVYINESCIGCGNCQTNCPYDVIRMVAKPRKKPGLLSWMLFGLGNGPGESSVAEMGPDSTNKKIAVKCDACVDLASGPACEQSCPTGAARRISPFEYIALVEEKER